MTESTKKVATGKSNLLGKHVKVDVSRCGQDHVPGAPRGCKVPGQVVEENEKMILLDHYGRGRTYIEYPFEYIEVEKK